MRRVATERRRLSDLVARNVATLVPTPAGPKTVGRSLTLPQAHALLAAAQDHPLEAAILVALTCGLRPGELLALHWEDIDLEAGEVRIRQAIVRTRGKIALGPTKTPDSRRQLRLPDLTATALAAHRSRQDEQRHALGEYWQDHGLVFPTGLGTLLDPANLRRGLRQVTERAPVWDGGTRTSSGHSATSLLSAAGVPLEQVADVLGHTSTRVTSSTYRHPTTPTVEAAAAPMDRLFGSPKLE